MKANLSKVLCGLSVLVVAAVVQTRAVAQTTHPSQLYRPHRPAVVLPYYPGGWWRGGTAWESYARGAAAVIHSQGMYNVLTAQANEINAHAYRQAIENRKEGLKAEYELRKLNQDARFAELRQRAAARIEANAKQPPKSNRHDPKMLTKETGEVAWPAQLQGPELATWRADVERVFAARSLRGYTPEEDRATLAQAARAMLGGLNNQIGQIRPMEYTEARRFLETLAREGRATLG
jgi:hypothetical protein